MRVVQKVSGLIQFATRDVRHILSLFKNRYDLFQHFSKAQILL